MFNNILVPVDLSLKSQLAIKKAIQIAHQFKSHITILNVQESFMNKEEMEMARVSIEDLKEKFRKIAIDAKSEIKALIDNLYADDINVEIKLREGMPSNEILNTAININADVIIMGTNGRNSLQDIFLGSTSENVIRASKCPVLIIPS